MHFPSLSMPLILKFHHLFWTPKTAYQLNQCIYFRVHLCMHTYTLACPTCTSSSYLFQMAFFFYFFFFNPASSFLSFLSLISVALSCCPFIWSQFVFVQSSVCFFPSLFSCILLFNLIVLSLSSSLLCTFKLIHFSLSCPPLSSPHFFCCLLVILLSYFLSSYLQSQQGFIS